MIDERYSRAPILFNLLGWVLISTAFFCWLLDVPNFTIWWPLNMSLFLGGLLFCFVGCCIATSLDKRHMNTSNNNDVEVINQPLGNLTSLEQLDDTTFLPPYRETPLPPAVVRSETEVRMLPVARDAFESRPPSYKSVDLSTLLERR